MGQMSDATRTEVCEFLFDCIRDSMFGDGLEDDYVRDGFEFKGLNNMTDEELVNELTNYTGEDEELVVKAKAELAIEAMLSSDSETKQ